MYCENETKHNISYFANRMQRFILLEKVAHIEISGYRGLCPILYTYKDSCLLGCNFMYSGRKLVKFRENMLSLSLGLKKKPREKTRMQMRETEENDTCLQTVFSYCLGLAKSEVLHRRNLRCWRGTVVL